MICEGRRQRARCDIALPGAVNKLRPLEVWSGFATTWWLLIISGNNAVRYSIIRVVASSKIGRWCGLQITASGVSRTLKLESRMTSCRRLRLRTRAAQ